VLRFKCGTVIAAHWWQLGRIADQQQFAAGNAEDMLEKIGKQIACAESTFIVVAADHAGLVDNEESTGILMGGEPHSETFLLIAADAVDAPVDGAGEM